MLLQPARSRRTSTLLLLAVIFSVSLFAARPAFAGSEAPGRALAERAGLKQWAHFEYQPPAASGPRVSTFTWHELAAFADTVADGQAGVLRGVYVRDVLALRVTTQPAGAPFAVDLTPGTATQYGAASDYGVTGLLADNVASGVLFYLLQPGQTVSLVYGDGSIRDYVVTDMDRYQALNPTSPYSDFIDLATGERVGAASLFVQKYTGGDKLTLQTCIAQDGVMAWGRLFVTAVPAH